MDGLCGEKKLFSSFVCCFALNIIILMKRKAVSVVELHGALLAAFVVILNNDMHIFHFLSILGK